MANSFSQDKMHVLWEDAAEQTGINMTLSKDLEKYDMDSMTDKDRATDGATTDREYIPQEYRFDTQDGNVSTDGDFQDIIDRNIPVNRTRSKRVLAFIDTKGLRDPTRRKRVADAFAREIADAVDTDCYQTMLNQASMNVSTTTAFDFQSAIDAEVLMLNRGLSAFQRKLFLSNTDYAQVAKDLGQNQYYGRDGLPSDALMKAKIPNLATFDTMRSDYLLSLAGNVTAGLTINGLQEHTPATYDANGFFLDNRSMTLNINTATPSNMPVGTKFTIAGINALNPRTRTDNGELMTFTVIGTGTGSAVIQPAIDATSVFRNVSAAAADTAAIVVLNNATSNPSLFYTPESTVLIPGLLPVPSDSGNVAPIDLTTEQGLPMRMTYRWDFHKERFEMKAVIYYDVQVIYPEQIGTILSNQT